MKARCWLVAAAVFSPAPCGSPGRGARGPLHGRRAGRHAVGGVGQHPAGRRGHAARPARDDRLGCATATSTRPTCALQLTARLRRRRAHRAHRRARPSTSRQRTGIEAGTLDGKPLFAFFEPNDYEEVGFEVGFRYYLATQSRLKSYVAPVVGVRFLQRDPGVLLRAGGRLVDPLNVPFTQGRRRARVRPGHRLHVRPRQALLRRHGHGHPLPVGARASSTTCPASARSTTATAAGPPRSSRCSGCGSRTADSSRGSGGRLRTPQNRKADTSSGSRPLVIQHWRGTWRRTNGPTACFWRSCLGGCVAAPQTPVHGSPNLDYSVEIE